jgi:uncharacterized iron-regulated membrane protein
VTTTIDPPVIRSRTAFAKGSEADRRSRFWRTVWRVHFYAGMLVIPFLVTLAVTGTLILYEDPITDLTDHDLHVVDPGGASPRDRLSLDDQVAAVRDAYPDHTVGGVTPPDGADGSTMVALAVGDDAREVYVDPYTGDILGSKRYHDDLPGLARRIHGNLLFGWKIPMPTLAGITGDGPLTTPVAAGDLMIELMASWGLVLVATGLYLWWPRKREAGKALFKPRLSKKGRARWRDLHAIPGAVLSLVLVFLVLTGLPWSGFWGGNWDHLTNELDSSTNTPTAAPTSAVVHAGDLDRFGNPVAWAAREHPVPVSTLGDGSHEQHRGHEFGHRDRETTSHRAAHIMGGPAPLTFDRVARAARNEHMTPGYSIALPVNHADSYGSYTVTNPFARTSSERTIYLDQFTGDVLAERAYNDYGNLAKATAWGIDVHMGTQYGLANRIVMTTVCLGVVWSAVSGLVMWWKRRPHGKAGFPRRPPDARLQRGLVTIAATLGTLFPLVGVSMVGVVVVDRYVIRRVPVLRRTFGMR